MLCPLRLDVATLPWGSPPPLDAVLMKKHVVIDDADFDDQLEVYAKAAVAWAEGSMHRTIYARAHVWVLKDFPRDQYGAIRLPRGKTQSVQSVQYSSGGSLITLQGPSSGSPAGSDYQEDLRGDDGGVLMPARGGSWPSVDSDVPAPVAINFMAGWAADAVPSDLLHALWFSIADAFDLRGTSDLANAGDRLDVRETLISAYRLIRWY